MRQFFAQIPLKTNLTIRVIDNKTGKPKKIFKEWRWVLFLQKIGLLPTQIPQIVPLFGRWAYEREYKNLIVNAGKAGAASRLISNTNNPFTYIAIGTGTTAPTASDTALQNEVQRGAADTVTQMTTSVTNDTAKLVKTFTFTSSQAITESGIFNASSGGTMLARQTFAGIGVDNSVSLQIEWRIQVS